MAIHRLLAKQKSEGDTREGNKKKLKCVGGGGVSFFYPAVLPFLVFFFSRPRASPALLLLT